MSTTHFNALIVEVTCAGRLIPMVQAASLQDIRTTHSFAVWHANPGIGEGWIDL